MGSRGLVCALPVLLTLAATAVLGGCMVEFGRTRVLTRQPNADYQLPPLHRAAFYGKTRTVRQLLVRGAAVDSRDQGGRTALHWAGRREVAELLVAQGGDMNARDSNGWTPLHTAALQGTKHMVPALLELGANPMAEDNYGNTALHWASTPAAVTALLGGGANLEATGQRGEKPLHVAASQGNKAVVEALLAAGANVNARNSIGSTPLHQAAGSLRLDVVELLLAHGADINAQDQKGHTPLFIARTQGVTGVSDMVTLLRQNGARE
ncbi:MAG: hypothetical protein HPY69_03845 [Armatimonadetes bacterium]|nr:hypothetical protein [Armatimonadota bacterium]